MHYSKNIGTVNIIELFKTVLKYWNLLLFKKCVPKGNIHLLFKLPITGLLTKIENLKKSGIQKAFRNEFTVKLM